MTDRTAPAKEASVEQDEVETIIYLLRALAGSDDAKVRRHDVILNKAADLLQSRRSSPVREGDRGLPDLSPSDVAPSAGWMPIKTAPRSRGSHLLLFGSGAGFALCAVVGALDHDGYWRALWNREAFEPTHWMYLPDSPHPLPQMAQSNDHARSGSPSSPSGRGESET